MPDDVDAFIVRDAWGTGFDKVWWLGGTFFYGSPLVVLVIMGAVEQEPIMFSIGAALLTALGVLNWRIRAKDGGRLLAEVTAQGSRVNEGGPVLPWSDVAWVGFEGVGGGTYQPTEIAMVMHLHGGVRLRHVFRGNRIEGIHDDFCNAVRRFAPQIPISRDGTPPPEVDSARDSPASAGDHEGRDRPR